MDSLQSEVWLLLFYREEFSESEQPVEHKATLQLEIHACDIEHLILLCSSAFNIIYDQNWTHNIADSIDQSDASTRQMHGEIGDEGDMAKHSKYHYKI